VALITVLVVLLSFEDEGVGSSFVFAGARRRLSSWVVGFAGRHLSLFVGCGLFVAMAVICGMVVVVCGRSQGVVGGRCHFWAVVGR